MEKTLYLHLGTHKTGSTTIQSHLYRNADNLAEHGILYPELLRGLSIIHRENHHNFAFLLTGRTFERWPDEFKARVVAPGRDAVLEEAVRAAIADMEARGLDKLVISSEVICEPFCIGIGFPEVLERLRDLFSGFRIVPVVYLRPQHSWAEAWYKWQMRGGNHAPLDRWYEDLDRNWLDYERLLDLLSAAFGRENVRPRIFERAKLIQPFFQDFLTTIGHPDLSLRPVGDSNESFHWEVLRFQRMANRTLRRNGVKPSVYREMTACLGKLSATLRQGDRRSLFPHDLSARIYSDYREMGRRIGAEYFGIRDGDLFSEPPVTEHIDLDGVDETAVREQVEQWLAGDHSDHTCFDLLAASGFRKNGGFREELERLLKSGGEGVALAHGEFKTAPLDVAEISIDGESGILEYPPLRVPAISAELITDARIQYRRRGGDVHEHRKRFSVFAADGRLVENNHVDTRDDFDPGLRPDCVLDESGTIYVLLGELIRHYGHLLLESMSRLWIAEWVKGLEGRKIVFVLFNDQVESEAIDVLVARLSEAGEVRRLDRTSECIAISRLLLPSPMVLIGTAGYCHPAYGPSLRRLFHVRAEAGGPDKIYFSRRKLGKIKRSLVNEARIEKIFEENGYTVVHPQELGFERQLSLYTGVRAMAGMEGSALHNMLFAGQCRSLTILNVFDPDMPKAWNGQQRNICRALCMEARVVRMVPVFRVEGFFLRRMPFIVRPGVVSRELFGDRTGDGSERGPENRRALFGMVSKFLRQAGDESGAIFYKHVAQDDLSGAVRYGIRASTMPPSVVLFGGSFGDRFRLAALRSAVRVGRAFGGGRGK